MLEVNRTDTPNPTKQMALFRVANKFPQNGAAFDGVCSGEDGYLVKHTLARSTRTRLNDMPVYNGYSLKALPRIYHGRWHIVNTNVRYLIPNCGSNTGTYSRTLLADLST